MYRRVPTGPSRRHSRSDACCGVVNAMLGSEFCATSPLSLIAMRSTTLKTDGKLLAGSGVMFHGVPLGRGSSSKVIVASPKQSITCLWRAFKKMQ